MECRWLWHLSTLHIAMTASTAAAQVQGTLWSSSSSHPAKLTWRLSLMVRHALEAVTHPVLTRGEAIRL